MITALSFALAARCGSTLARFLQPHDATRIAQERRLTVAREFGNGGAR